MSDIALPKNPWQHVARRLAQAAADGDAIDRFAGCCRWKGSKTGRDSSVPEGSCAHLWAVGVLVWSIGEIEIMRIFAAVIVLLAAGGIAWATDLPAAPPPHVPAVYIPALVPVYNWSGLYVGGNADHGFANANTADTFTGGTLGGIVANSPGNARGLEI